VEEEGDVGLTCECDCDSDLMHGGWEREKIGVNCWMLKINGL